MATFFCPGTLVEWMIIDPRDSTVIGMGSGTLVRYGRDELGPFGLVAAGENLVRVLPSSLQKAKS